MKMKKLIAVLLSCVLLCAIAAPALGENCYEIMKALLADTSTDLCMGDPMTTDYEITQKVLLMYTNGTMGLFGVNGNGQGELAIWFDVDTAKAVYVFYTLAQIWDNIAALPDYGYDFSMVLCSEDGESQLIIDDAVSAANYVAAVEELLNQ